MVVRESRGVAAAAAALLLASASATPSDILLQTYTPEHLMSFAPSQQPGGNCYYDYQSCALPSPAVDYSANDAPDVDASLWVWDASDPDFLTCATTGVSFPNGDFEENATTLGPTLAGHHVEVTAIKSAYPEGLHQCSACGDTGWRGETRYESDWCHAASESFRRNRRRRAW